MAKAIYFYDASGVRRKIKQPYFYDTSQNRRKITKGFYYDASGVRRQFWPSIVPNVLQWNMTVGASGLDKGYISGQYGSVSPTPVLNSGEVIQSYYLDAGYYFILKFSDAMTTSDRGAFNYLSLSIGGNIRYLYSSTAYYNNVSDEWVFYYRNEDFPMNAGAVIPCQLVLGAPSQNTMTAGDIFSVAIGYNQSGSGSMAFGGAAGCSAINGKSILAMYDSTQNTNFVLELYDKNDVCAQNYFNTLVINGKTYQTSTATFTDQGGGTKRWTWNTRAGFAIGNAYGFSWT